MSTLVPEEVVLVLDFGSQYAQLIARRIREQGVYCEIVSHSTPIETLRERSPRGLILSGGPCSVYADQAPICDPDLFRLGVPVLGICYGMQLGCQTLGGKVGPADSREYGRTNMRVLEIDPLFTGLEQEQTVWMSHGDAVSELEGDFQVLATSDHSPYAAVRHATEPFYGLQFHPEVSHTPGGAQVIRNFLIEICGLRGDWRMADFRRVAVEACREKVGDAHVVLGLSGGVDSAVVAALVHEAIGDQLHSIFVDNGLLREGESDQVVEAFSNYEHFDLTRVDATELFLDSLAGVTDPEDKRKRIGHVFIDVFEEAAKAFPDVKFLAQGTLYPDVIESVPAHGGPTAKIKSHHNVGGLPETLGFELLEPLRYLFKDEVRRLGEELGLPESILWRQPFPGPGLAIRIAGDITRERLTVLRQADTIVRQEIDAAGLTRKLWQSFCCLVPVQTVGVMGDERTYEDLIAVRAVESADGMTADWARLPADLLDRIANRVIGEVRGVNRVVYDITSKPPGTIEWE